MNRMFTVILLRPDYLADTATPADTFMAHVYATDANDAIDEAQMRARRADENEAGECTDYYPIAVFHCHLEDAR